MDSTTNRSSTATNTTDDDGSTITTDLDDPVTTFEVLGFACCIFMIVIGAIGVLGNTAAIRYFGRRASCRATVNVLLTALSTFDLILLLTGTPLYSLLGIYSIDRSKSALWILSYCMTVLYPVSHFAQMGSVWTMTAISFERYLGVCRPFFARRELTIRRMRLCVIIIAIFSMAYNACRFWEYTINSDDGKPVELLRNDSLYLSVYMHWMYFAFIFCFPLLLSVVFNCLVAVGVRRAMLNRPRCQLNVQQRQERKTTLMLMVVVAIFVVCNGLSWPLNAYEAFALNTKDSESVLFDFLSDLNNLLVLTHPLLNILTYMYFSRTFRHQFIPFFDSRSNRRPSTASTNNSSAYYYETMSSMNNFITGNKNGMGTTSRIRHEYSNPGDLVGLALLALPSTTMATGVGVGIGGGSSSSASSRRQSSRYQCHSHGSSSVSLMRLDQNGWPRSSFSLFTKQ